MERPMVYQSWFANRDSCNCKWMLHLVIHIYWHLCLHSANIYILTVDDTTSLVKQATLATSTQIVWTFIFEILFLHEQLNLWSLAGTALILGYMMVVGVIKIMESEAGMKPTATGDIEDWGGRGWKGEGIISLHQAPKSGVWFNLGNNSNAHSSLNSSAYVADAALESKKWLIRTRTRGYLCLCEIILRGVRDMFKIW